MYPYIKADWHLSSARRHSLPSRLAVILVAAFVQLAVSFGAEAGGRVALVLVCEKYENFKESDVDVKWAGDLGQALKERNFDVTVAGDRNDAESRAALREFSLKSEGADFALIVVGGHVVSYQSQSFFLPQNAKIQRATDLFSRALSLTSIADIAGKAKSAALLVLMTVPDIPATVSGIDMRPAASARQAENVVSVFSSSPRVPLSGVDRVAEQATEKLLAAAQEEPLKLTALVNSVAADGVGQVFGKVADIDFSAPLPKPEGGARAEILQATEAAAKAQAEAERRAHEASLAREQAEAERNATDKRLREERERARLAEERAREAEQRASQAQAEAQANNVADTQPLPLAEDTLTLDERKEVQRRLQRLRLYRGIADSVFGEQTREAIKEFQKLSGAPETGYLTRAQFERLVQR